MPTRAARCLALPVTLACLISGSGHTAEAPALMQHQVAFMQTGGVLDVSGLNPVTNLPKLSVSRAWTGGTLIFSDSPEYVEGEGILYADTLSPGPARLFVYHVNATTRTGKARALKFSVVVEPADPAQPAGLTVLRRSVRGPSTSYMAIGALGAADLLGMPETPEPRTVSARQVLDTDLERSVPGDAYCPLVQAQYDLQVTGAPLKVTVVAMDAGSDTLTAFGTLTPLARPEASPGVYIQDRGTFPGQANKTVTSMGTYGTSTGLAHFRMAGGASYTADPDPFAGEAGNPGFDAILGIPSRVLGNYGVVYTVRLRLHASDGRRVAILLNPRGGNYTGAVAMPDALTGAGTFLTPTGGGVLPHTTAATLLGRWDPKKTPEITIYWTPPGASSLPVEWIMLPYPEPGDVDGNGLVDLGDAVTAARIMNGLVTPSPRARIAADQSPQDVPDGIITPADIAAILRRAAL